MKFANAVVRTAYRQFVGCVESARHTVAQELVGLADSTHPTPRTYTERLLCRTLLHQRRRRSRL
jgi:hypothetical protein